VREARPALAGRLQRGFSPSCSIVQAIRVVLPFPKLFRGQIEAEGSFCHREKRDIKRRRRKRVVMERELDQPRLVLDPVPWRARTSQLS
jgi:hypothetical protein